MSAPSPRRAAGGWLAAALAMALALWGWWPRLLGTPVDPTAWDRRTWMLADRDDAVQVPWVPSDADLAQGASGDLVWSDAEGRGFARFRGLAVNDPALVQLQIWVVDAGRQAPQPVDAGLFDVTSAVRDLVIPVEPRLPVARATRVFVTAEAPGGAVVSSRERQLFEAALP